MNGLLPHLEDAVKFATQNGGTQDKDLFSSVLSNVMGSAAKGEITPATESEVQQAADAHDRVYNQNAGGSSQDFGAAAALQALKMFAGNKDNASSGTSSGGSSALMGMAMGEATKLFNNSNNNNNAGGQAGGSLSDILQQAARYAMKLFLTYQGAQGGVGGALGSLMGMFGSSGGSGSSGMAAQMLSKLL